MPMDMPPMYAMCVPLQADQEKIAIMELSQECAAEEATPDIYNDLPKLREYRRHGGFSLSIKRDDRGRVTGLICHPSSGHDLSIRTTACNDEFVGLIFDGVRR